MKDIGLTIKILEVLLADLLLIHSSNSYHYDHGILKKQIGALIVTVEYLENKKGPTANRSEAQKFGGNKKND